MAIEYKPTAEDDLEDISADEKLLVDEQPKFEHREGADCESCRKVIEVRDIAERADEFKIYEVAELGTVNSIVREALIGLFGEPAAAVTVLRRRRGSLGVAIDFFLD